MPRYDFYNVFKCILGICLFIYLVCWYTYIVNARRAADDPKKRDYPLLAVMIAPFTTPFLIAMALVIFVFTAVLYAGFLILFAFLLVIIRKPFIFKWWDKFATMIGEPLLRINSNLIKLALRPWNTNSQFQ